jgi:hypothetical protein
MTVVDCAVCREKADDITPSKGSGIVAFRCKECGEYEVAEEALHRLQTLDAESRREALAKAKRFAQPNTRPCISSSCFLTGQS